MSGERLKVFEPGTLWTAARQRSIAARAAGALQPIETSSERVVEGELTFLVRVVSSLERKDEVRRAITGEGREVAAVDNPFLPWEEELFVGDVSETHLCLLNKFPVLEDHLLIVTREFEEQDELLGPEDFEALWRCLVEAEALGFYNGGEEAGASQRHKHLQMIRLPLDPKMPELPVSPALAEATGAGALQRVAAFPFVHAYAPLGPGWFDDLEAGAAAAFDLYQRAAAALGIVHEPPAPGVRQALPYNLLVTREWMLLVPRSAEFHDGVSINAVGFAGGLLVRSREQLARVIELGPMQVLTAVAISG